MSKLTLNKSRELISHLEMLISIGDVSDSERLYLQALEIALPVLEQQESTTDTCRQIENDGREG